MDGRACNGEEMGTSMNIPIRLCRPHFRMNDENGGIITILRFRLDEPKIIWKIISCFHLPHQIRSSLTIELFKLHISFL